MVMKTIETAIPDENNVYWGLARWMRWTSGMKSEQSSRRAEVTKTNANQKHNIFYPPID